MRYLMIVVLLIPGVVQSSDIHNSAGTTVMTSVKIPVGARNIAMGSVGTALGNDAASLLWNPAGIRTLEKKSFVLEHSNWLIGISHDFLAFATPLGPGSMGVSLRSMYLGNIEARSHAMADPEYYYSVFDLAAQIGYAIALGPELDLGLTWNILYSEIDQWTTSANSYDIGLRYHVFDYGVELGFALQNLELNRMGIGKKISYDKEEFELPLAYRLGASWEIKEDGPIVAVEGYKPLDNFWTLSVGGEYPIGKLALRGGIMSNQSNIVPTFGIGYQEGIFNVDLALYQPIQELEDIVTRIGLQLLF